MKNKIILLFLDLEGTLISEENGEINGNNINNFLASLNNLEKKTGAKIHIHIASPVSIKSMERIIDFLDMTIVRFNKSRNAKLDEVHSGVAYPDIKYSQEDDTYDRIFPMQMPREDFGRSGKLNYVRLWIENAEEKGISGKELAFSIYGGNGINDVGAMKYIRDNKKGFVVCPSNSDKEVKKIAHYISNKEEANGVADGIDFITSQIEKRIPIDEITKKPSYDGESR